MLKEFGLHVVVGFKPRPRTEVFRYRLQVPASLNESSISILFTCDSDFKNAITWDRIKYKHTSNNSETSLERPLP